MRGCCCSAELNAGLKCEVSQMPVQGMARGASRCGGDGELLGTSKREKGLQREKDEDDVRNHARHSAQQEMMLMQQQ